MGAKAETQQITGLILPVEWDQRGKVKAVAIAAYDESNYRVAPGGLGAELASRLKREVTVWGRVECLADGKTILIEGYEMSKSSKGKITGLALAAVVGLALTAAPVAVAADQGAATQPAMTKPAMAAPAAAKPAVAKPAKTKAMKAVKRSPKVRMLQDTLNSKGAKLKVDGIMGKKTRMALKAFQKQNGLKVTGKVDAATKKALGLK
ncbi:MAG: peptidoglycan-binding protein [Desulfarculaceae bacterium]|nr:peptidoglycan-binding protein [Desulfarculaceae bacterium]MCF8049290.1 peptidoglycan-binding protein [Desulfarculaceae bacterium]MCF8065926.1 peptidoglycan-binding protein [Desulfarculaceae bacterium]MCF8099548.1 peptidoglycan-binding protein [Desulfarculaceae bacterium]MCF8122042.1 peptidoglycan-binding protein [Desulfarculaceae bacterium]